MPLGELHGCVVMLQDGGQVRSSRQTHLPASRIPPCRCQRTCTALPPTLIQLANDLGFLYCASGPMVRSSYRAGEFFLKASWVQGWRRGGLAWVTSRSCLPHLLDLIHVGLALTLPVVHVLQRWWRRCPVLL